MLKQFCLLSVTDHPHGIVHLLVDKSDHTIIGNMVTCASLAQASDSTYINSSLITFVSNCKCEDTYVQACCVHMHRRIDVQT